MREVAKDDPPAEPFSQSMTELSNGYQDCQLEAIFLKKHLNRTDVPVSIDDLARTAMEAFFLLTKVKDWIETIRNSPMIISAQSHCMLWHPSNTKQCKPTGKDKMQMRTCFWFLKQMCCGQLGTMEWRNISANK